MISDVIRFIVRALTALALLLGVLSVPSDAGGRAVEPGHAPQALNPAEAARLTPEQAIVVALDDLRLSDMGGDDLYAAISPAVAYNTTEDEYLVVWYGDDNSGLLVNGEDEIFGQRVDGASGAALGAVLRLSDMGPDGNADYGAFSPAVAYNSTDNEYLVVWYGDDNSGALADGEHEVYGQRVDGATGAELGGDVRFGTMGPDGDTAYYGRVPDVAYNSTNNQYLVVWAGTEPRPPLADEGAEIYGQRVEANTGVGIGGNFRLSDMGPAGWAEYDAWYPAVAYNSTDNQYLVIWYGDDNTGTLVDDEEEVFGQRVDGATGAEIGANDVRLSNMGPDGNTRYDVAFPDVIYNGADNEYLVVWWALTKIPPLVTWDIEIFGQRVNGVTGAEVGANDFRLSDMGPDGDAGYGPPNWPAAALAYNHTHNEYLVVWHSDDNTGPLVEGEYEVFGQRVDGATGAEVGANDFRISHTGRDVFYDALDPAVAYNRTGNEYLVVWQGDDNTSPLVDGEYEIWGQRVDGATGAELGADFRLSRMGPDGDIGYGAQQPAVAYSSAENEYLVVWAGDGTTNGEYEIYGQRVEAATGIEIGGDVRLSAMGPDGDTAYDAYQPAVVYNGTDNEYLVVWRGDSDSGALVDEEFEIYGQRVDAAAGAGLAAGLCLSDMGPDGDADYDAWEPAVAYNSTSNQYLVVWRGDDNTGGLVDEEFEIFGQRLNAASGVPLGTNDFRLSDMGPDGNVNYDAFEPAVAYNSVNNQYLVVWRGDDNTTPLVDGEYEIFGQRVDGATASELGGDLRLSDMGPDGNVNYQATVPAVAYSARDNEYLVAWSGDDDTTPLVDGEYEIFGQRVVAASGAEIESDSRLSRMGPDGQPAYDAREMALACDSEGDSYLVVWSGDDDTPPLVDDEFEIWGWRFSAHYRLYLPLVVRAY